MSTLAPEPPQASPQPPLPPPEEERGFLAPRPTARQRRNSSRVNATISLIFHLLVVAGAFFFAAREGMLGKQLKSLAVVVVPKEKKPEPPKPKAPEPKKDLPKEPVKQAATAPKAAPAARSAATAPPPMVAPPAASATIPAFEFTDGAKPTDPINVYKELVEYALRTRWNKPDNIADDNYVAEVNLSVDSAGKVTSYDWLKGSNDKRWDDSVKQVLGSTKAMSRPPPAGFPAKFVVRFDVEAAKTEPVVTGGAR